MGTVRLNKFLDFHVLISDHDKKRFTKNYLYLKTVLIDHGVDITGDDTNESRHGSMETSSFYGIYVCCSDQLKLDEFVKYVEQETNLTISIIIH